MADRETEDVFHALVKVLRDHDIPYDREGIKAACRNPEGRDAVREWIEMFLGEETLLSKDEATLYATLAKSGEVQRLETQDLSLVQGLSDQGIQIAIEELKRSTEAIEKQTEMLRLQQNAMSSLVKNEKRIDQARMDIDEEQERKWDIEKGQISSSIEEISQTLTYQTLDLEQQLKASEASTKQVVDSLLKSDDKLLLSLQKLASDLEPGRPENNEMIARIRELCARLIKYTVEGIRTKLDRIYLSNLGASSDDQEANSKEINDLQEELESLYTEILPVAQMSTEQQFLEPALRDIAASAGQGQERSVKAVKYMHDCLDFLLNRVETFLSRAQETQSHNIAVKYVLSSAKAELTPPTPVLPSEPVSPSKPNIQRRRKSSTSSMRLRTTRRSSGHFDEEVDPEQQLARNLGITLPEATISDASRVEFFENALAERIARLESHMIGLQSTTETNISSHLADAHVTLGLLRDSLLKESRFGKVRLMDKEMEESVEVFENEVEALSEGLGAVDLRGLQGRNILREQLVGRWSRN